MGRLRGQVIRGGEKPWFVWPAHRTVLELSLAGDIADLR